MRQSSNQVRRAVAALGLVLALGAVSAPVLAVTLQEEIELGKKLDVEILKQTPLSSDKQAQKEINDLGQKLVNAGIRRPEIEYHFKVIKDDDLNAFSTPGGYIYFSERLWDVLRRDERIGVLAHEIIHSDRRHGLDAMLNAQRRQMWLAVLLSAVNASSTWANIADLAHSLYTMKYSRADEREADRLGVDLCHKAGLNPAGLLLAMRKIKRFEEEAGARTPKIFSSHPPTKERLEYITQLLNNMGVPIPSESVNETQLGGFVGEITAVRADRIDFPSSKTLKVGDIVWVVGPGWDYHYENRTGRPVARGIVQTVGSTYSADIWPMPTAKAGQIKNGAGVYAFDPPKPETGAGRFEWRSRQTGDKASLVVDGGVKPFQRFLTRQIVWNADNNKLVYDNTGYVVALDSARSEPHVAITRPSYSYAPAAANSILVRFNDPDAKRWLGPIVSIGRSGQTIELATQRTRDELSSYQAVGKRFDVLRPAWDPKEDYSARLVGKAALRSLDRKIVLQMVGYAGGQSMDDVANGMDVYEEMKQSANSK